MILLRTSKIVPARIMAPAAFTYELLKNFLKARSSGTLLPLSLSKYNTSFLPEFEPCSHGINKPAESGAYVNPCPLLLYCIKKNTETIRVSVFPPCFCRGKWFYFPNCSVRTSTLDGDLLEVEYSGLLIAFDTVNRILIISQLAAGFKKPY